MRGLDDTDREILRLLLADSRRPYSEIADAVDLSAPAVSDRVERLEDLGLIRQFTLDLDRSLLQSGTPLLVTVRGKPGTGEAIHDALQENDRVQHLFRTADDTIVCTLVSATNVGELLADYLPMDAVRDYEVKILDASTWTPRLGDAELNPECVECGNTVSNEGTEERLDGRLYHFCCPSCRERFLEDYEAIQEGV